MYEISSTWLKLARMMNCPNFATDNSRKPYWEKRIKLYQEVVESSKNEQLIEGSKQFIKEAEKILKDIA